LGFNSTTIKGIGADDVLYTTNSRFNAVQLGVAVPIFCAAQKARIRAARFGEVIAENEYQYALQSINSELLVANVAYKSSLENVLFLEKESLPSAKIIQNAAQRQFENGAINYLEWVQFIHQSVSIENNYLDAVKKLNEATIQLQFFNN
jgi:cobalt-zinc-cadmium resistance protein CzcA